MGLIPANHIKILPYGDDGNEKVTKIKFATLTRTKSP